MGVMQRPSQRPSAVASRDGTRVYVANTARDHLFVIDTRADDVAHDLFLDFHPADVAVALNDQFVYVVGCRLVCTDGTLIILDAGTLEEVRRMTLPFVPTALAVTPDGRRAYVADGRESQVSVVDLVGQTVLEIIPVGPEPVGIAMNASGSAVYVTSFRDGTLSAISTGTNDVVGTARVGGSPRAVVVSRDGTRAFVTHSTSTLTVVDLAGLGRR
jgi:YVTN family beta-propeller protein